MAFLLRTKGCGRKVAAALLLGWAAAFVAATLFSSHGSSKPPPLDLQGSSGAADGVVARPHPPGWKDDPMDYPKPRVFFDIAIDGVPAGRIIFELFTRQSPLAAENFRALCTGEKGSVPNEPEREGAGQPLHFKGKGFYRVIDAFICQMGAGTESVFGGPMKDDPGGLMLKHDRPGLLSVANMGPDTTTSHFSIMMNPAHHLDGSYVIFGQVVEGFDVVQKINVLARTPGSKDETPRLPAIVVDCGELK